MKTRSLRAGFIPVESGSRRRKVRALRRGFILIEFVLAIFAALLVGASLVVMAQCTYSSQSIVTTDNLTDLSARKAVDTLAAHIMNAYPYQTSSSPITYAVLSAGSSSAITCYTNSTGDTERFWVDTTTSPYTLKRTQTVSGVATTTVLVNAVQSVAFTYYLTDGVNYTAASWVSSTSTPTAANLPAVGAVNIVATVSINGFQQQLTSFVRLRNSPYRS